MVASALRAAKYHAALHTAASTTIATNGANRSQRRRGEGLKSVIRCSAASAADLKFLHRLRQTLFRNFKSKSGTRIICLLVPLLLPKFVSEGAAMYHELRKRGTRADPLALNCRVGEQPQLQGNGAHSRARFEKRSVCRS